MQLFLKTYYGENWPLPLPLFYSLQLLSVALVVGRQPTLPLYCLDDPAKSVGCVTEIRELKQMEHCKSNTIQLFISIK